MHIAVGRTLVLSSTLLAICLLALTSLPAVAEAKEQRFKVVTTFTVIADMARNVAGDAASVESITKPGAEIHDYQLTPGDLLRAQDAQLILYNGLGLERWFQRLLRSLPAVPSVVVTAGITPIPIGEGPYRNQPNPHAWMSPTDALVYVDNIRAALVLHDPTNAAIYERNAKAYSERIRRAGEDFRARLARVPEGQRWLVTSEGAFSYLARDFGLSELYLWPINADQQGSPRQVQRVIDGVRKHRIPVVFSESTIAPAAALQVARETGARYGGVLYVDSLSAADGPVPTYLDLLATTVGTIAEGLATDD